MNVLEVVWLNIHIALESGLFIGDDSFDAVRKHHLTSPLPRTAQSVLSLR